MNDGAAGVALLRLLTWLSPAFPVGAFAYSGGLERAVHDRWVHDAASLETWISTLLQHGPVWNDAVIFAQAWRNHAAGYALAEIASLAEALAGSRERHQETMALGAAFLDAAAAWSAPAFGPESKAVAYPVAVGAVSGANGVVLDAALAAYLHAAASQLVSAGLRLGVAGQRSGVAILARLEPVILATAAKAKTSTPDDLGSSAIRAEIGIMRHETQYSRLFRS